MKDRKFFIILLFAVGVLMIAGTAGIRGLEKSLSKGKGTGAAGRGEWIDNSEYLRVLPAQEYEAAQEKGTEIPFSASDVLWYDSAPACDEASAAVYIPCDLTSLSAEGASGGERFARRILAGLAPADTDSDIYICDDEMMDDPAQAMAAGHPFEAFWISGGKRASFQIILTGLPAVCIDKTDSEEIVRKEEHEGRIRYISLNSSDEEQQIRCRFHVRGNVSSTLEKRPYKVSLLDRASDKYKTSLGGLREDDDWILNPLYTDSTRVREMTAYALWDQVTALSDVPQASSRMRYVELFLDDSYQGIYGLMEPVDGKQLGLTEGDLLFKIDRWDREYPYLDLYEEKAGETEIYNDNGFPCVEMRFPKNWDSTASWTPMQAYHLFTFRTQDPRTLADAGLDTDMDSVVSLSLYCALTHAMDNTWKNSFVSAKRSGSGYTLYRTVWDLNYVFGDVFIYAPDDGYTVFDPDSASAYVPLEDSTYDFEAFMTADSSVYDALCAKWAVWREGGVDAQTVCASARRNMDILTSSGAMAREMEHWPQDKSCGESLEEMEEWIRNRFAYLDQRFGWNTK